MGLMTACPIVKFLQQVTLWFVRINQLKNDLKPMALVFHQIFSTKRQSRMFLKSTALLSILSGLIKISLASLFQLRVHTHKKSINSVRTKITLRMVLQISENWIQGFPSLFWMTWFTMICFQPSHVAASRLNWKGRTTCSLSWYQFYRNLLRSCGWIQTDSADVRIPYVRIPWPKCHFSNGFN